LSAEGKSGVSKMKPCPCEACEIRKALANAFDIHIYGDDCWRICEEFEEWKHLIEMKEDAGEVESADYFDEMNELVDAFFLKIDNAILTQKQALKSALKTHWRDTNDR